MLLFFSLPQLALNSCTEQLTRTRLAHHLPAAVYIPEKLSLQHPEILGPEKRGVNYD